MRSAVYLFFSLMASCLLCACVGEDTYSLNPADRLTFSVDTLDLDTVVGGESSETYSLRVYNPASQALRLSSVALARGAESHYRVNVDGTFLVDGCGTDFEIGARDSLVVWLFIAAPDFDSDTPQPIHDALVFRTEAGAEQQVTLCASSQSVIRCQAPRVVTDEVWDATRPYQIFDSLYVAPGATLRLAAGTRLYFHAGASLVVDGTLRAEGTAEAPVVMRGDRLGNMFSGQPYDRIPGQWGGIDLRESSHDNLLQHCDIHSGSYGVRCTDTDATRQKLLMEHSVVHNVTHDALHATMSQIFVGNSQITNAGRHCVALYGGDNSFVHCTIARFYAITGAEGGMALLFQNYEDEARRPLTRAAFANCLISGYGEDELMGDQSARYVDDAFGYGFQSCLIRTPKVEDDHFVSCIFENEGEVKGADNFYPAFDFDSLIFPFTLSPESQAVGKADATITQTYYPYDLLGRSRFADADGPDIGCYEAQPVAQP